MVKVKPIEHAKANYRPGASVAPSKYREGVSRATGVIAAAIEAEELWKAKMSEAIAEGRRAKGLSKVSDEEWRKMALEKGAARIGPGMTAAVDKWAARWNPFRSALEAVSLPPRGPDPIANIDARVKPIVEALVAKKKELLG